MTPAGGASTTSTSLTSRIIINGMTTHIHNTVIAKVSEVQYTYIRGSLPIRYYVVSWRTRKDAEGNNLIISKAQTTKKRDRRKGLGAFRFNFSLKTENKRKYIPFFFPNVTSSDP